MSLTKDQRNALPESDFAVPGKRKLPMHDATHVRLAHDMVDRTQGLTDHERAEARHRILKRAHELGVDTADWTLSASVSFEAMAIEMPSIPGHPNRMPFSGVLTRIDQPSDAPPGGSTGHRTFLPKDVAEAALPTLLGMAVDFTPDLDGHDRQSKIGLITAAEIVGDAVHIEGFFYAKDFPRECERIRAEKDALGFSFEVDARIQDVDADPWVIEHCVFTGAAVLYKDLAAYTTTSLSAHAEEGLNMTPEELKAILGEAIKPISVQLEAQGKEIAELKAKGVSLAGPIIDQVKPHVEACNAAADAMEAAGIGTHADNGHVRHLRHMAAHMAAEAIAGRVPHIYRDHDYLSDARVQAGKDKGGASAEEVAAAVQKAVEEATKPLKTELEAAQTKLTDLQAKAFNNAEQPQRVTITPEIKTLLAKAGIAEADVEKGKLTAAQVDKVLEAQGIRGEKAIETKLKLRHAGLMEAGKR